MKEYKAVIFDMDGVILDTEQYLLRAWHSVAEERGMGDLSDFFAQTLGKTDPELEDLFEARFGYRGFAAFQKQTYERATADSPDGYIPLRRGAKEFLQALRERNIKIGLASSSPRERVEEGLQDAGVWSYFDTVWAGDMVEHGKPDPELFLRACDALEISPAEAYGIEDGEAGVRAIHAAKMRAILAEDTYHPSDEVRTLCEVVLPSLEAAQAYLLT